MLVNHLLCKVVAFKEQIFLEDTAGTEKTESVKEESETKQLLERRMWEVARGDGCQS